MLEKLTRKESFFIRIIFITEHERTKHSNYLSMCCALCYRFSFRTDSTPFFVNPILGAGPCILESFLFCSL